mgnify:CR=1 FL=1
MASKKKWQDVIDHAIRRNRPRSIRIEWRKYSSDIVEFLEDLDVSLLTNRRTTKPFGLEEGESGKPGCNTVLRPSISVEVSKGSIHELDSSAQLHVKKGTVLRIETPGGGGFGKKS